jgi:hypothetical protein
MSRFNPTSLKQLKIIKTSQISTQEAHRLLEEFSEQVAYDFPADLLSQLQSIRNGTANE